MSGEAILDHGINPRQASVLQLRLVTALLQGTALYLLTRTAQSPPAPFAVEGRVFVPLLLLTVFIPAGFTVGLKDLPSRPLTICTMIAALVVAGLGYHDAARGAAPAVHGPSVVWPSTSVCFALTVSLLIAYVLAASAILERRLIASYSALFEAASELAVRGVLALLFVGLFWGTLVLGAGLFKLVNIDLFLVLIMSHATACFATPLAFGIAVHVTDVQPALIRGVRSLALNLLSWLLPVLAVILLGFLITLPFIFLAPLWKTHFATGLLLTAAILLIGLVNCCYQDGAARVVSRTWRLAGTVGALELMPLAGLAVWGLALRVGQHGWTVDRIYAAAVIAVVSCVAIGYALAALSPGPWLRRIEATNVAAACLCLALVAALFTPPADPARLMVANQTGRLASGAVPPDKFDFVSLKFEGARWGADALTRLWQITDNPGGAVIRVRAARALAMTSRPQWSPHTDDPSTNRIDVFPPGRSIPEVFQSELFWQQTNGTMPACFWPDGERCVARFMTLRPGDAEVIVFMGVNADYVFELDGVGQWRKAARITGRGFCEPVRRGLARGEGAPEPHDWPDLVIAGQRLVISAITDGCPSVQPGPTPPRTGRERR